MDPFNKVINYFYFKFISSLPNPVELSQPLDLALYKEIKSKWEGVVKFERWKQRTCHSQLIPNKQFPSIFKEFLEKVGPSKLENCFSECGIVPLDKDIVRNWIPTLVCLFCFFILLFCYFNLCDVKLLNEWNINQILLNYWQSQCWQLNLSFFKGWNGKKSNCDRQYVFRSC